MYVSQNPKSYDRDSVPLLSWVQGEDGFPRFEGVDLQPTQGYVVHFKGAINDYEVSLDGTIALPVCSVKGRSYVFSDNFDGKNIVCDTVVTVEMIGDSIWGLDMSDIANIDTSGYITLSFYSNVERDRVHGIEGDYYVARTQYDSPDVDTECLIACAAGDLQIGSYYLVKITKAEEFDFYAEVQN